MAPLSGIRVLDFTQVILGPAATQVLADFGADVIKVERPGLGDLARAFAPYIGAGDRAESAKYLSVNRNKRSLALDLKSSEGRATVLALLPTVDVLVHNFRPGVMDGHGLSYESLSACYPRLIYAEGSGWGSSGPLAEARKPGHELLCQSFAGLAAKNAGADGLPRAVPATVSDFTASQLLVQGILLALLARERTGAGQRVEVSLLDGLLALQQWDEVARLNLGDRDTGVSDHAHPLQSVYRTADGFIALVGWFRPDPLANVCRALGLPDASLEPRFATLQRLAEPENAAEVRRTIAARVAERTSAEWLAILEAHGVLCGEVLGQGVAYHHPQAEANAMVSVVQHPALGPLSLVGAPVKLSATPATVRRPPPRLGEHSGEIRDEIKGQASAGRDASAGEGR